LPDSSVPGGQQLLGKTPWKQKPSYKKPREALNHLGCFGLLQQSVQGAILEQPLRIRQTTQSDCAVGPQILVNSCDLIAGPVSV
jgi:hypothetical protein